MSKESVDIDTYVELLISDRKYLAKEYRKYVDNCYIIQDVKGDISNNVLIGVIKKAFWNRKLRAMLDGILWHTNKNSITDEVFRLILKFPYKQRNTFLETIVHNNLAFYQFQLIYKMTSCWEAFAWLFYKICEYDFFQEEDMLQLLRENKDITYYGIQDCIDWAKKKGCSNTKLELAQAWADSMCVK